MKTATVTWISYNNYGTVLQAYALQKKIEQLGFENMILDDSKIIQWQFAKKQYKNVQKIDPVSFYKRLFGLLTDFSRIRRSILCRVNRNRYVLPYEGSQEHIKEFKRDFLKVDRNVEPDQLNSLNDKYDVFISGSDQIWSVFPEVFNPYYYLSFCSMKKISYAPSLGTDMISEPVQLEIKELLKDYSAISVREQSSSRILSELLERTVSCEVDPVLLHDKAFWFSFGKPLKMRKKYMLCYFLEDKEWYFQYAKKIAKQLHLRIVLIPSQWDYLSNGYIYDGIVGVQEFVGMFAGADFVLTDSYHGSLFSLLFEKNFHHLLRFDPKDQHSQNIRVESLFTKLGINEVIVKDENSRIPAFEMDYSKITPEIKRLRNQSIDYLIHGLTEDEK